MADVIETNNLTFAEIYAKRWKYALVVQYFTISVSASFSFETNPTIKPQKGNLPRKVNQI